MKNLIINIKHDSSIAVYENQKLTHYFKIERFNRLKHSNFINGAPILDPIFEEIGREFNKVFYLAIPHTISPNRVASYLQTNNVKFNELIGKSEHHILHAINAYKFSNFSSALVFVIDRNGSCINAAQRRINYEEQIRESESVYKFVNGEIEELDKKFWSKIYRGKIGNKDKVFEVDRAFSICKIYETAINLIKEGALDGGKVMGLASYGKDDPSCPAFFSEGKPVDSLFKHNSNWKNYKKDLFLFDKDIERVFFRDIPYSWAGKPTKDNYQFYANYAYQVQKQTQEEINRRIKHWVDITGINNVIITGGYGLNVVANSFYIKNNPNVNFFFDPLSDDSGITLGAGHYFLNASSSIDTFLHGFEPDNEKLKGIGNFCSVSDVAKLLTNGKSVAVFTGKAEAGARALGHRSILFEASNPNAKEIVNVIKKREWYRPFAASVLEEDFNLYFDTLGVKKAPFMTMAFNVNSNKIPGVTHVDNSCRVQTVDKTIPHFYSLLNEYKKLTGISVLLNTSFNLAGDPLVENLDDALLTFYMSELDALWFPSAERLLVK